ncbi:MAG: type II toxin-antitoxin system RelE/ParE family toxin [Gammaproteobacteria bacterium]|nr:type II toxin-antitoxin system RelE/ParE family toxin [Gammaproteobacteria bacterium]
MTEAARFYERETEGLGADFLDDVQRAIDRLRDNPRLGLTITTELRRSLLSRFPFSVIYAVEPEGLLIVAVAHQRRRPGYWRGRATP